MKIDKDNDEAGVQEERHLTLRTYPSNSEVLLEKELQRKLDILTHQMNEKFFTNTPYKNHLYLSNHTKDARECIIDFQKNYNRFNETQYMLDEFHVTQKNISHIFVQKNKTHLQYLFLLNWILEGAVQHLLEHFTKLKLKKPLLTVSLRRHSEKTTEQLYQLFHTPLKRRRMLND